MKKKGFTLVELLAVIAILAILVIMVLPAVLRMYRQSRINNFQNEVRSVYRIAQNQFLGDSITLGSGQDIVYTNGESSCPAGAKTLDMTGNSKFKYYVELTVSGQVTKLRATNGTYSYKKDLAADNPIVLHTDTTSEGIKIDEIIVDDIEGNSNDLTSFDIAINVCTGRGNSNSFKENITINIYETGVPEQKLLGATFDIKRKDNNEIVDTIISDNDGSATSILLETGEYILVNTYPPEGYAIVDAIEFEIIEDSNINFINIAFTPIGTAPSTGGVIIQFGQGEENSFTISYVAHEAGRCNYDMDLEQLNNLVDADFVVDIYYVANYINNQYYAIAPYGSGIISWNSLEEKEQLTTRFESTALRRGTPIIAGGRVGEEYLINTDDYGNPLEDGLYLMIFRKGDSEEYCHPLTMLVQTEM